MANKLTSADIGKFEQIFAKLDIQDTNKIA